jgi:SAM-dependent methyltransferase
MRQQIKLAIQGVFNTFGYEIRRRPKAHLDAGAVGSARIRFLNYREGGLPLPPPRLIHLAAGTTDLRWFLEGGALAAETVRELMERNGVPMNKIGSLLDFGCGVGRVTRHWAELENTDVHGTDYNPEVVSWCRKNLKFARFNVNKLVGQTEYENETFDLIYALSVFTHLTEANQFFWIEELTRLLHPGGYLLITTHGDFYLDQLTASQREAYKSGQLVVVSSEKAGSNLCGAYHPESYVRETLAGGLTVVDYIPEGALGNPRQDVYLLRKPAR